MTERSEVYKAIDGEREYQDLIWDDLTSNRTAIDRSIDEFTLYVQTYASEAAVLAVHGDEDSALHHIRKIGALCVACMEKHGAPKR